MISKTDKTKIITQYGRNQKDTGSSEVQVALLTQRINSLSPHFETHKLDINSRRGLMKMIGKRRRHLKYLNKTNPEKYNQIIKELGLRK
jgi:small subunit ribosomal protein S15